MTEVEHVPVMLKEAVEFLAPREGAPMLTVRWAVAVMQKRYSI